MPRGVENPLKRAVRSCLIELSLRTGIFDRSIFSLYNYMFSPSQLMFLAQSLGEARDVPGCCIEIGCANGRTTVFLRRFMDENGIAKDYWALDTFGGFVAEHVEYEAAQRGKTRAIGQIFTTNKRSWFEHSLKVSGVGGVNAVEGDATKFDYDRIGPIAFALLDVDLYLPIRDILPRLYRNLSPGGIIVVDDCMPHEFWDGALVAYDEFAAQNGLDRDIVLEKLGVVRKP